MGTKLAKFLLTLLDLLSYVFREIGIELPRYSGHQAKVGITVDFDELQKGDLVFFDTEHKFRGKVNHLGYI